MRIDQEARQSSRSFEFEPFAPANSTRFSAHCPHIGLGFFYAGRDPQLGRPPLPNRGRRPPNSPKSSSSAIRCPTQATSPTSPMRNMGSVCRVPSPTNRSAFHRRIDTSPAAQLYSGVWVKQLADSFLEPRSEQLARRGNQLRVRLTPLLEPALGRSHSVLGDVVFC